MKSLYLTLLAACLLTGCNSKTPETGGTTGTPEPATGATTATTTASQEPAPKLSEVPASVKHAAYQYYGLGNEKPMDVELRAPGVPTKTGGIVAQLQKVENGKALFKVARTGSIADDLGDDSVMVDSTGVYMTGTSIGTISPEKFLALPADVAPGKTWKLKTKVVRKDGQQIEEDSTYKIEGIREVTTKAGVQKALLVTSNGTANVSLGGQKETAKYQTKSWYVKGVGPVKIEIALTSPGKPARTLVVEQSS